LELGIGAAGGGSKYYNDGSTGPSKKLDDTSAVCRGVDPAGVAGVRTPLKLCKGGQSMF